MRTMVKAFYSECAHEVCDEINAYANNRGYEVASVSICELHGSIQAVAVFKRCAND